MDGYQPGIAVAAGRYMVRWNILDPLVHSNALNIMPGDELNIFINFESVLRNMAMNSKKLQHDLIYYKQNIVIELESAILNLMAHYRLYFEKKEKCNTNLYFYYTDLTCGDPQEMQLYNKFYRSYYKNRYMQNPNFRNMGQILTDIIIPEVELIISYIPNCYFIKSKTFDSSIIPRAISATSSRKNVIVTGDIFDTLYMFDPNFMVIYVKNRFQHFNVYTEIEAVVQSIVKDVNPFDLNIFQSELYFRLLLAVKGSKIRNIKAAKGFGYVQFTNIIKQGIANGVILKDFSAINSIISLFPEKYREDIKEAFLCTSIETQYEILSISDKESIDEQKVDRIDMKSLEALNNKRFLDFPINLGALIG